MSSMPSTSRSGSTATATTSGRHSASSRSPRIRTSVSAPAGSAIAAPRISPQVVRWSPRTPGSATRFRPATACSPSRPSTMPSRRWLESTGTTSGTGELPGRSPMSTSTTTSCSRPMLTRWASPCRGRCRTAPVGTHPLASDLDLTVIRRHPTTLTPETMAAVRDAPLPPRSTDLPTVEPAVSVVVVTHNNLVFTRLCLESLLLNTAEHDVEIIVVDNASSDMTPAYLRWWPRTTPASACSSTTRTGLRLCLQPGNQGRTGRRGAPQQRHDRPPRVACTG